MNSDKSTAKLLGFIFLFVVAAGMFAGLTAETLDITITGAPDNISETMIKISENTTTMRISIIGYLVEALAMVLLAVLLYTILNTQNKVIARWAFGLWIVQAAFVGIKQISAFSLLNVSQEFAKAGAPVSSYFQTLGSLFFDSMQFFYHSQMFFYTAGGALFYYLFLKSKYIPAALSIFGIAVASLGFVGGFLIILDYDVSQLIWMPILPFELAIGIWLLVKGIKNGSEPNTQPV